MKTVEEVSQALLMAFKRDDVKKQVLEKAWYEENIASKIDSTGFCYVASAVIFELTGGTKYWKLGRIGKNRLSDQLNDQLNDQLKKPIIFGHCYLISKSTDKEEDITKDQYSHIQYSKKDISGGKFSPNIMKKARILARLAGLGEI